MKEGFIKNTINITEFTLRTSDGSGSVEISEYISSFDLYESIYTNTLTGTIDILDTMDMVQKLPIIGAEILNFEFNIPGIDTPWIMEDLQVYKISDRKIINDKVQQYKLWFTSRESISNIQTRLTKSWKGKGADTIIKDILTNSLKSKKTLDSDSTVGMLLYIAPTCFPFQSINYICQKKAINGKCADFLFFESLNTDGLGSKFNFKSLSTLVKKSPVATLRYEPQTVKGFNEDVDPFNVEGITFFKDKDRLSDNLNGLSNQTIIYYDVLRKKYVTQKLNYYDLYKETEDKKMGTTPSVFDAEFNPGTVSFYFVNTFPTKISSDKGINSNNPRGVENKPNRKSVEYISKYGEEEFAYMTEQVAPRRRVQIAEFEQFKVHLNGVSGNYLLFTVGNVVNFQKPHIDGERDVEAESSGLTEDVLFSGNYLIVRNRHHIVKKGGRNFEYKNFLEISRNTYM